MKISSKTDPKVTRSIKSSIGLYSPVTLGTISLGTIGTWGDNMVSTKALRTGWIYVGAGKKLVMSGLPAGWVFNVAYNSSNASETALTGALRWGSSKAVKEFYAEKDYVRFRFVKLVNGASVNITLSDYPTTISLEKVDFTPKRKLGTDIYVAAFDAPDADKLNADFICDGVNDEFELQAAVDEATNNKSGRVKLSTGSFVIDSFPNVDVVAGDLAIAFKKAFVSIEIVGGGFPFGTSDYHGTKITISNDCYNALDPTKTYRVFGALSTIGNKRIRFKSSEYLIQSPGNQKKIIMIDNNYVYRMWHQSVDLRGWIEGFQEADGRIQGSTPLVPIQGFIGLRGLAGSNTGTENNLISCQATGLYEGFALGSEHLVAINLSTIKNYYGYTFGNYDLQGGGCVHPMTLINCSDERNVCLPLFKACTSKQRINMIDMCIEISAPDTPGGVETQPAVEWTPNAFNGDITFTMYLYSTAVNIVDKPYFTPGGQHGRNFKVRNSAHELFGTTATRQSYAATNFQEYYDTTLSKMVKYINGNWRDAMGVEC